MTRSEIKQTAADQETGVIQRSADLVKQVVEQLRQQPQLLAVPILAVVAMVGISGLLLLGLLIFSLLLGDWLTSVNLLPLATAAVVFIFYWIISVVSLFSEGVIIVSVYESMSKKTHSLKSAYQTTMTKWPAFFAWATVLAMLMLASDLAERLGEPWLILGLSLLTILWAVTAYFLVPSILFSKSGGVRAWNHSVSIIRQVWLKAILTNIIIIGAFFILAVGILLSGVTLLLAGLYLNLGLLASFSPWVFVVDFIVVAVALSGLSIAMSTANGALVAILYQEAETELKTRDKVIGKEPALVDGE